MMSCSDSAIEQNGAEPAVLADRRQLVAAPGEDLVRVGLVTDVPEHLVAGGLEQGVQGDRELAGAEVGAEVPADLTDGVDDVLAHLLRDLRELVLGQRLQVGGTVDARQQPLGRLVGGGHEVRV